MSPRVERTTHDVAVAFTSADLLGIMGRETNMPRPCMHRSCRGLLEIRRAVCFSATLCLLSLAFSSPVHGSGRLWHCLYATGRDGTGPPNTTLQVCSPADGKPGYRLALLEDDPPHTLIWARTYGASIQFRKLEVHEYPANDMWKEGEHYVKQFPKLLFVGQGTENHRPVTLVWSPGDEGSRSVGLLLKVYRGDARRLDQPTHGSREKGGIVVEHAKASWLPEKSRPKWARKNDRIVRVWTYSDGEEKFHPGPWRRAR